MSKWITLPVSGLMIDLDAVVAIVTPPLGVEWSDYDFTHVYAGGSDITLPWRDARTLARTLAERSFDDE